MIHLARVEYQPIPELTGTPDLDLYPHLKAITEGNIPGFIIRGTVEELEGLRQLHDERVIALKAALRQLAPQARIGSQLSAFDPIRQRIGALHHDISRSIKTMYGPPSTPTQPLRAAVTSH